MKRTTAGERRVEKMRHLARTELKAFDKTITETSHRNQIFRFAGVPPAHESTARPENHIYHALLDTPLRRAKPQKNPH